MTFCSNSVDFELPRVGEVWHDAGKDSYQPGETPKRAGLWLVVGVVRFEEFPLQLEMMNLESGALRRIPAGKVYSKHHNWKRFASPDP